ncbi:DEAD/DEAH box helicase [Aquimonas sp.]|jgi:ATP-dependent Lhr-like helicase|uniref:DEAD/DEAH box helicase n=1 Tax=Aquimonas sp. TaxID=1872588 RepID=UPI0037C18DDD
MAGFDSLDRAVQQWIWQQGWRRLRPIQEEAIEPILARKGSVVIAAPTAGGKTEAAFLPIASRLARRDGEGVLALAISPLKALINDQARRLEHLFESVDLRVQPWHGDVSKGRSQHWKNPAQVLLITPESLEAMLMRRAGNVAQVFARLEYVVVDELHAFMGTTRGAQMLSLLRRLECLAGCRPVRVGLSATLGDLSLAARYLDPGAVQPAQIIRGESAGADVRIGMLTVVHEDDAAAEPDATRTETDDDREPFSPSPPPATAAEAEALARAQAAAEEGALRDGLSRIADHLFAKTRGQTNLVFANARARVELLTDELVSRSETMGLPVEAFAHHGSLSREHRAEVETRLREGQLPTTVVCTSTLELGIDIGDVDTVAQVGPAPTVSSLKQRVGRSGRRAGQVQTLRQYVDLTRYAGRYEVLASLRLPLLQSIATVEGLLEGQFETPNDRDWHLSTLVQQILSRIAQGNRGERAQGLYSELCAATGPFGSITIALFSEVLRAMGASELIEQISDGSLLLARAGEALTSHYSFYASFLTPEEYRVMAQGGKVLGSLPIEIPISEGQLIVLAGRRWRVLTINPSEKLLTVEPGPRGRPPGFGGGAGAVGAWVQRRMRLLLESISVPAFLDPTGRDELASARRAYDLVELRHRPILHQGDSVAVFHWAGSATGAALAALLADRGLEVEQAGPAIITHGATCQEVIAGLMQVREELPGTAEEIAEVFVPFPEHKFDEFLTASLLQRSYARRHVDLEELRTALSQCLRSEQ